MHHSRMLFVMSRMHNTPQNGSTFLRSKVTASHVQSCVVDPFSHTSTSHGVSGCRAKAPAAPHVQRKLTAKPPPPGMHPRPPRTTQPHAHQRKGYRQQRAALLPHPPCLAAN